EWQFFVIGIKPQCHRSACTERREKEVIRAGPRIKPTGLDRFIGKKAMRSTENFLLEFAAAGLSHENGAGFDLLIVGFSRLFKISFGPGRDHIGYIDRVASLAQKVIGTGKRYKTLRMFRRGKDSRGVFDADSVVGRRMKHQQCPA